MLQSLILRIIVIHRLIKFIGILFENIKIQKRMMGL